jgi:hypothetical protein
MMQTRTYAEILARQGEFAQAIAIYEVLVRKSPSDASLRRRLGELATLAQGGSLVPVAPKPARLVRLESLLHRIQSRRRNQ